MTKPNINTPAFGIPSDAMIEDVVRIPAGLVADAPTPEPDLFSPAWPMPTSPVSLGQTAAQRDEHAHKGGGGSKAPKTKKSEKVKAAAGGQEQKDEASASAGRGAHEVVA